jgi:hypothetical protein
MAKGTLKGYEAQNLAVLLCVMVGLFVLGAVVFKTFRDRDKVPPKEVNSKGIMNEVVSSTANSCYFYLTMEVTEMQHKYRNRTDIPSTDDGFAKGLFDIPGVIEVTIDRAVVTLQKSPKAHWEEIRPLARDLIATHLHMHKSP